MSEEEESDKRYKPRVSVEKEPIVDELGNITEKEFRELDERNQWNIIAQASKIIRDYRITSDKNCELCKEHLLIDFNDINIDLLFEDWRECSLDCEHCDKGKQTAMCQIQFDIMNHLASGLFSTGRKLNNITELLMKSDIGGSELLKSARETVEKAKQLRKDSEDMFA